MTAWDIHLTDVQQVLQNVSASAEQYVRDEAQIMASLGELGMALPSSPQVRLRIEQFADEVIFAHLRGIVGDTAAALQGTADAVIAYQEGDLQMARHAQDAVARVPHPDAPRPSESRFGVR